MSVSATFSSTTVNHRIKSAVQRRGGSVRAGDGHCDSSFFKLSRVLTVVGHLQKTVERKNINTFQFVLISQDYNLNPGCKVCARFKAFFINRKWITSELTLSSLWDSVWRTLWMLCSLYCMFGSNANMMYAVFELFCIYFTYVNEQRKLALFCKYILSQEFHSLFSKEIR